MDRLQQIILNIYPSVNINYFNDVAPRCTNSTQQLRWIEPICKDKNRVIIIELSGNMRFNKLAH